MNESTKILNRAKYKVSILRVVVLWEHFKNIPTDQRS